MTKVKKDVLSGETKLLYVAPESLTKEENVAFLQKANISLVAIDEAHCISEWGHDFRPEYRKIKSIIDSLGNLPIIALTATATPKVQTDIQRNLQMEEAALFKSSFNRKNLYYEVRPKIDTKKQLIKYVKQHKGKSGIVYCLSRKKVEEIAELLAVNDVKALPYHAGLDPHVRMANQDAFLNEDVDVIVATIAFGMGIDKPDVRFVIHYDTPKSLEGYYQETGRAGRDGLEGNCVMFYSYDDIIKLDKFNKDKQVTERENAKHLLQEMASYAESSVCRRRQLLHYFGEQMHQDCGFCDNCLKPREKFQAQEDVMLAIQAVLQTNQRFDITHLSDVLRGLENQYVISYGHNRLPIYGKGAHREGPYWCTLIRQILLYDFLEKDIENYGVLRVSEKGIHFMENPYPVTLSKTTTSPTPRPKTRRTATAIPPPTARPATRCCLRCSKRSSARLPRNASCRPTPCSRSRPSKKWRLPIPPPAKTSRTSTAWAWARWRSSAAPLSNLSPSTSRTTTLRRRPRWW
jgi:ATP-dependent DNA helicase RecQ